MIGSLFIERIAMPADTSLLALDGAVIKAAVLADAARVRNSEQKARRRAAGVLKSARRRAAAVRAAAAQAASQAVQEACDQQARGMAALSQLLADAVGELVQAALQELLLADTHERARLCAALAQETLERELAAVVAAHPDDMAALTAVPLLQNRTPEADATVAPGTLVLRTAHGQVTVEPARLLQNLCADLRRSLAAARDARSAPELHPPTSFPPENPHANQPD